MIHYLKMIGVFLMFGIAVFLGIIFGNMPPDHLIEKKNYETKYDSLQQQLQFQQSNRIDLTNRIDSLYVLVDSLTNVSKSIQVEIREVPGKYNTYNSEELTKKMIESYNAR